MRLSEAVELRRGFDLPTEHRVPGQYLVLSAGKAVGSHNEGPVSGPGFTVGRATNLGVPTWSDHDYWPLNTTLYAADFKGNNPKFLYHLFQTLDLAGYDSGSVQPMLNRNYISSVPVLLPDLATQQSIVEVLGALDDKIAANELRRSSAWELARSSFKRDLVNSGCIEDFTLGELSVRRWLVLGDGYRTKVSEFGWPGLRVLRAGDIRPDRIDPKGDDYVSVDHVKAIGAKASKPRDIVATTKGTVGRVAVVSESQEQVVYSPQLCFFRVVDHENLNGEFLAGWFRSSDFAAQAEMRMYKSDMAPYINLKDIQSMVVPVPVVVDQRRIGDTQDSLQRLAHSVDSENTRLAATRDELLHLLMSGKLRVKHAEKVVEDSL